MSEFVSSEIAHKLKEKGFPLLRVIKQRGEPIIYDLPKNHPNWQNCNAYYIPTTSQVLKWLREEKGVYLGITYVPQIEKCNDFYFPTIQYIGKPMSTVYTKPTDNFKTYEEAAFTGIEYIINNLI